MRVTVSHNKSREEVVKAVNDAADKVLSASLPGPLQISNVNRAWNGNQLDFSLTAGLMGTSSAIKGFILVGDRDITIDVDLPPLLTMFVPEKTIQTGLEQKVRGLLE